MANILFIGGTRFMGYFAAEYALARGHSVTLFNRGKSDPGAFPNAERIVGDRDADLDRVSDQLRGRKWDAVIDTSGMYPRVVRKSAELLAGAGQYVFISTISVFADTMPPNTDENGPLNTVSDPTVEKMTTAEDYGGFKVLCEQAVADVFGDRALIIRPSLIVGPHDYTNRFDYWVSRVAEGGEVLAPARPDFPVQFIDARDLGEWVIRCVEARTMGTYNATGVSLPLDDLLSKVKEVSGSDAHIVWASEGFLLEHGVIPWQELPLWTAEKGLAFNMLNVQKAINAGLTFRPLADTVRDTLNWVNAQKNRPQTSLPRDREQTLLNEWHAAR